MFHFWREGGGEKGNRCMTYDIRIRSGPAHSSPVTRTVCVYEPTGAIQRGVTVRLHGVCQSAPLIGAMASAGKVCISPYYNPRSSTVVLFCGKRSGTFCFQNLSLAKAESRFWGMRTAPRFAVVSFKRPWGAQILQEWRCKRKGC